MIYIDSSVLLADLFVESRTPPAGLWDTNLVSSRLLAYEVWSRVNARRLAGPHQARAQALLERVALTEMNLAALARALRPFPIAVRTLDGLHLATIDHLQAQGERVELASYDNRMLDAARAMGIAIASL